MWVILDCAMLIATVVLEAWRLTGVVAHEWLAMALVAGVLAHLAAHWPWVRTRARRIRQHGGGRTRVNFFLNVAVFAAMTAAIVSGVAISKSIVPSHSDPATYLKWRSIHGTTSRIALFAVGLHLGLNWDLLVASLRRRRALRPRLRPARVVTVAAWMIVASVAVAGALLAVEQRMHLPDITMITPNGRRIEHAEPPADIARLRADEAKPSTRGFPPLAAHGVLLAASCLIGRKVLRLRLD